MNELYIEDCYIYFKTNETNARNALDNLYDWCSANGIELYINSKVYLRTEEGVDIDECE